MVEPKPFKNNWHLDAICDHLAYVTFGDIRNLMINIPPRQTKSLTASVLWPVWEWLLDPGVQFLFASYAQELAIRDAVKSRRLMESAWFKQRYSGAFYLDPADNRKNRYVNNHGGHRISGIPGVDGFLADRLGVPVEIFNPLEAVRLGARKFDAQSLGQMAPLATVAIGLATRRFDYI
jgi:hypothetical protein